MHNFKFLCTGYTLGVIQNLGQLDIDIERNAAEEGKLTFMKDLKTNTKKHLMVKSDGDDTLENMRIASLEKDSEIVDDDDAIQVMRINEHGEAIEIVLGEDDDDESLILQTEKLPEDGVVIKELKDLKSNSDG